MELTDDAYRMLVAAAAKTGETSQPFVVRMASALAEAEGVVHYTDDEFPHALAANDEEIAELAKLESISDADE